MSPWQRMLWWQAGSLSALSASDRWHAALHRAAVLLEPTWPNDGRGPFSFAPGGLALLLYAGDFDRELDEIADVPAAAIVTALRARDPGPQEAIREGLPVRGHDLDAAEDQISALYRGLTVHYAPVTHYGGIELPSFENPPGGTPLQWGLDWTLTVLADDPAPRPAA